MKIRNTLVYMFRNPMPILVHFMSWILFAVLLTVLLSMSFKSIFWAFSDGLVLIVILTIITSYREARGNLNGIARTQQVWMNWYNDQQHHIATDQSPDEPPPSKNIRLDSVFGTVKSSLLFMVRNPMIVIFPFICWFSTSFLGRLLDDPMQYTFREEWPDLLEIIRYFAIEFKSDFFSILYFIATLVIIISFQEARGNIKGIAKAQQQWSEWYQRQINTQVQRNTLEDPPLLVTNETAKLFMSRNPISLSIHFISLFIFFTLLAVLLILNTTWDGVLFLPWIAVLVFLIH